MDKTSISLATLSLIGLLAAPAGVRAQEGDWSGFHVGIDAGQTRGTSESDAVLGGLWAGDVAAPRVAQTLSGRDSPSAVGPGIRFGYDHQFANRWVLGIEADYRRPGMDESASRSATIDVGGGTMATVRTTTSTSIDRMYSVRPRVGYAAGNLLWYATAGYARSTGDARSAYTFEVASLSSRFSKAGGASIASSGLVWGVGLEWRFAEHWNAGLRYTRAKGGSATYRPVTISREGLYTLVPTDNATETVSRRFDYDDIALSVSYRF